MLRSFRDNLNGLVLGEESDFHLVNRTQIYVPIQDGGLAVRNLKKFNHALFGKWL